MDIWIDNSLLPHCFAVNGTASCDLNVETDMPRVISQDDVESGLGGMTLVISILVVLLGGAGLAIAILLRRDNPSDSAFYDDDDDWDEMEAEDTEKKSTPILPSTEPDSEYIDATAMALDGRGDISKEATVETVVLPTLEIPSKPEPTVEQKKRKAVKRKKTSGKDTKGTPKSEAELEKLKKEKLAKKAKAAAKTAELMKLDIGDLTRKAKAGGVLSSGTKEEIIERLLR
jgi:hypothetical protein